MPFTPACAYFSAATSSDHDLVVIVWMQSLLRFWKGKAENMAKAEEGDGVVYRVKSGDLDKLKSASTGDPAEEGVILFALDDPLQVKRRLAEMIVAPHARFATRNFAARRNVIPAIRTMVD